MVSLSPFHLFYMFRATILKFLMCFRAMKCHYNKCNFVTLTITLHVDFTVLTNTHHFFKQPKQLDI